MADQISPDNDLYWYLKGIYGRHYGVLRRLHDRVQEEAQFGLKMDVDRLNADFYDQVEQGVNRYVGRNGNDMQRAAVRAYMEQLRDVVPPDEMIPKRKKQ